MKCTSTELRKRIVDVIQSSNLVTPEHANTLAFFVKEESMVLHFANEHIWGHTARLSISKDFVVQVGWSSTDRSPAMAAAALLLYSQVVNLAQHIQAIIESA